MSGATAKVTFIGAGPGAADLITLRGARAIAEADVLIWASSLVQEAVLEHARPDAEIVDSAALPMEGVVAIYERAVAEGLRVARIHSGDPSLWGAVQEQLERCRELGLDDGDRAGRLGVLGGRRDRAAGADDPGGRAVGDPDPARRRQDADAGEGVDPAFAAHGTTMAVFLSAARSGQLAAELLEGGYAPDTPVIVAYRATWEDEELAQCTIADLEETVKARKLWKHTLFLIGPALGAHGTRSHLYHPGHFHGFRRAERGARKELLAADAALAQRESDA